MALSSQDYGVSKEQHNMDSISHDGVLPLPSAISVKSVFSSIRKESGITVNI